MNPVIERFQKQRWSNTRHQIHRMTPGDKMEFPMSEYFNAKATVDRFNDAYCGNRKWRMSRQLGKITVVHL